MIPEPSRARAASNALRARTAAPDEPRRRGPTAASILLAGLVALLPGLGGAASATAGAPPGAPVPPPLEPSALERHRTPLDKVLERTLGETSRAVRFDWRTARLGASVSAAQLLELNNYSSASLTAGVRFPVGPTLVDVSFARVWTWSTESSSVLALTPYRQAGRPTRFELQANLSVPLAEGVSTVRWAFLPALELVFSVDLGFRYLLYPEGLRGLRAQDAAAALFSPSLSAKERENLETERLPAMTIDPGRYGILTGLSLHLFANTGLFVAPRLLLGLPLSRAFESTALGLWWEVAFAAGWMWR